VSRQGERLLFRGGGCDDCLYEKLLWIEEEVKSRYSA